MIITMTDLAAQIAKGAALAVAQMQGPAHGRLDYSEASLSAIEDLLSEAAQYRSDMSDDNVEALASIAGAYILEVGHRAYGGTFFWDDVSQEPILVVGEPTFHVAIKAISKVRSRLGGDPADSIPFFFEGFAGRVRAAKPGDRALFV